MLSHETANYITFSRPDLVDQFQHNIKPFWLTGGQGPAENARAGRRGRRLGREIGTALRCCCHKYNLECAPQESVHLRLPLVALPGLLDQFQRPGGPLLPPQIDHSAEEVLKINNDVVLLQDGLERTYRGRSPLKLKLLVSNFSPEPLKGSLTWELTLAGQSLASKEMSLPRVAQGEVAVIAEVALDLPDAPAPGQLNIVANIANDETHYGNDWSAWVYPAEIRPAESAVPVFAAESCSKALSNWPRSRFPRRANWPAVAVYVTDGLFDPRIVAAPMNRCASVLLLGSDDAFWTTRPVTFRTTWWKAGDTAVGTTAARSSTTMPSRGPWRRTAGATPAGSTCSRAADKCVFGRDAGARPK